MTAWPASALAELTETLSFFLVHHRETLGQSMFLSAFADVEVVLEAVWLTLFSEIAGHEPTALKRDEYFFAWPTEPIEDSEADRMQAEVAAWRAQLPDQPVWLWQAEVWRAGHIAEFDLDGPLANSEQVGLFERASGRRLPASFRYMVLNVPGGRLRAKVSPFAGAIAPVEFRYDWSEPRWDLALAATPALGKWSDLLVVCGVFADGKVLCFDFGFDAEEHGFSPDEPPLVVVSTSGQLSVTYVARCFTNLLDFEADDGAGGYQTPFAEPTPHALAWESHRQHMLGQ